MSALADLAAALLPPEGGGPPPREVARAVRRLLVAMPRMPQAGFGFALVGLEAASLARHGRFLGGLEPARRAALLEQIARLGPAPAAALDGLKTAVLLAAGADAYATEIDATGRSDPPARDDAELAVVPATELPARSSCDAVVVGSGAGGAFAARALARAGFEVVIVEEGERWDVARIRESHPLERFAGLYRDGGATFAFGLPPIALPQGRAVGGSTVMNSGTCYRPPAEVVRGWHEWHGLELAEPSALGARLDDVEATLSVEPVPATVMGRNGELALVGADALGWHARPLRRNAPGCRGACQCSIGCPNNAKAGVHVNALPQACTAGARIVSGLRAERVRMEGGRSVGVVGHTAGGRRIELDAARVIVACGPTETPALLRRSALRRHPRLGRNLSVHPALGAAGRFAEPVLAWRGVLQSVGVEELHERDGILIEATSTPPGMGSMITPGFGADLVRGIDEADHVATLGAMIADQPSGRVIGARHPTAVYRLADADRGRLRRALGALGRVLLAAGAERVDLGAGTPPIRDARELEQSLEGLDVRRLHLAAFHPSGTAAAGARSERHPVDPQGALRGAAGVWVADASILPSCPGVNPQLSIMALAAGVGEAAART